MNISCRRPVCINSTARTFIMINPNSNLDSKGDYDLLATSSTVTTEFSLSGSISSYKEILLVLENDVSSSVKVTGTLSIPTSNITLNKSRYFVSAMQDTGYFISTGVVFTSSSKAYITKSTVQGWSTTNTLKVYGVK